MSLEQKLEGYVQAKEELHRVKEQFIGKKRELAEYIYRKFISANFQVRKTQIEEKSHMNNKKNMRIRKVIYPELEIPEGFEKVHEGEMFFCGSNDGKVVFLRRYVLRDIQSGMKIYMREELEKLNTISGIGAKLDGDIKNAQILISYMKYTLRIGEDEFEYTRDYERDLIRLLN